MNALKKYLRVLLIAVFFIAPGCLKDFPEQFPTEYEWRPLLAFPIGDADFGLLIPHGFDTLLMQQDSTGIYMYDTLDQIPLYGSIGFDFEKVLGKRDEINMALLRVNTYNGFPIEVTVQAYLKDYRDSIIDSLFIPELIMKRGILSGGGQTAVAVHSQREILFDEERLDILEQTKNITFKGELNSVPFFHKYFFKVQMAAILGINSEL